MADRDIMSLQQPAPDRASRTDREDILREQWSGGFATRLLRIVRRAIAEEIRGHQDAGLTIPEAAPDKARSEAPHEPRN